MVGHGGKSGGRGSSQVLGLERKGVGVLLRRIGRVLQGSRGDTVSQEGNTVKQGCGLKRTSVLNRVEFRMKKWGNFFFNLRKSLFELFYCAIAYPPFCLISHLVRRDIIKLSL